MNNDLISREALREAFHKRIYYFDKSSWDEANALIDIAPTIERFDDTELQRAIGYADGYSRSKTERPQGKYEFIEILAQCVPDEICTYPEYRGKPYYSIHFRENGEEFVGFGTYNPEVLSRYLRDYFFEQKGGAE